MKDGIIKEMKNSRLLKADLPATYDELVALAANAGIPADVLFNAEGWQQIPTFLSKKNLLQDSTAGLLGLTGDPTVDDAFVALLLTVKQMALVRVTVTVAGAPAIADIEVTGLEGLDGGAVYTDASGAAVGFALAGEVSISTPAYQDLPAAQTVTQEVAAGEIVDVSLAIGSAPQAGDKSVTSTTSGIRFSPYVTEVDTCCIGAGAGGGCGFESELYPEGYQYAGGSGGGQGKIVNRIGVKPDTKTSYTAVVGARGEGAQSKNGEQVKAATNGGASSFMGVSASGGTIGNGGSGAVYRYDPYSSPNTTKKAASPGGSNTTRIFNDPSIELTGGDGGGSGCISNTPGAEGGSPGGGDGSDYKSTSAIGGNGTSYGSGGGGGYAENSSVQTKVGGDGYQGLVRYRWRVS